MEIIILAAVYGISFVLSRMGMYAASGILLMAAALILASYYCIKDGRRINPPAVFTMSWIGGIGVACLKLSYLETDWEALTWIALFAAYAAFIIGYKLTVCGLKRRNHQTDSKLKTEQIAAKLDTTSCSNQTIGSHDDKTESSMSAKAKASGITDETSKLAVSSNRVLYIMMNGVAAVSVISLIIEAYLLGYIPLFTTDTPHAYSYFHVSGLHYFTVSCCLLPALGTLCLSKELKSGLLNAVKRADIVICMGLGLLIPIMLVSRYQLFFGILLAGFCMLILNGMRISIKLNIRTVLAAAVCLCILIMLYVFITIERAHSVEYLNGIFEMKYESMPIFISQPYIYIANNFDNFNCLVKELPAFTHGLRMCFPVIALTGLKFIRPELAAFPIYITKEELTTVTLIYDSYYDFGLVGVIIFCLVIGAAAALIENAAFKENVPDMSFDILLYAEVMIYLSLAFFTTWLSNPTTWFLFGVTVIGMLLTHILRRQ